MNHPKAGVERMSLPREGGGRGLTQLELVFKTTTVGKTRTWNKQKIPFSNSYTDMTTARSFILLQKMPENLKESSK